MGLAKRYSGLFLLPAALAALLAACERDSRPAPEAVEAPREYRTCTADADCILVDNSCDACCRREAVNRKDSLSFEKYRAAACEGYSGAVCKCCYTAAHAECKAGRCTQVIDSTQCGGP